MARYATAGRATAVGTAARGMFSLYGTSGVRPRVREIGVFNTTSTAVAIAVVRFSTTGTQGAGLTESIVSDTSQVAIGTTFAAHTADATVSGVLRQATLAGVIGSGVIFTFGDAGIVIGNATTEGVGVTCPTGTGQICDYYIEWDE
jgi:hypothetical protein